MTFSGRIGLALSGGGAHGAWQAGALRALTESGLSFDQVLGFSAGALTGAGYALRLEDVLAEKWRHMDEQRVLRLAPRLRPFSLFSGASLWEAVRYAADEAEAKRKLRCELTVISLRVPQLVYDYARFAPGGVGDWDGPLAVKLAASCSIPYIFPNVLHEVGGAAPQRLVDGGVPGNEWLRFDALSGCRTVIALQMTRPEEVGRFRLWPWSRFEQTGREICYRQMASGIDSLLSRPKPPIVYRLYPSRVLGLSQLAFKTRLCAPAMELGYEDGRRFLSSPEAFRMRELQPGATRAPAGLPIAVRRAAVS